MDAPNDNHFAFNCCCYQHLLFILHASWSCFFALLNYLVEPVWRQNAAMSASSLQSLCFLSPCWFLIFGLWIMSGWNSLKTKYAFIESSSKIPSNRYEVVCCHNILEMGKRWGNYLIIHKCFEWIYSYWGLPLSRVGHFVLSNVAKFSFNDLLATAVRLSSRWSFLLFCWEGRARWLFLDLLDCTSTRFG